MAENERNNIYNDDDRQYLEMMQGNIERMAANSANCKTWMVTIVAAVMALQCSISALNGWILLSILPVVLFWYLDGLGYYNFRNKRYNGFVVVLSYDKVKTDARKRNQILFDKLGLPSGNNNE